MWGPGVQVPLSAPVLGVSFKLRRVPAGTMNVGEADYPCNTEPIKLRFGRLFLFPLSYSIVITYEIDLKLSEEAP